MKSRKKINKVGVVVGLILLIISDLLFWERGWTYDKRLLASTIPLLIAALLFHYSLFSHIGYKHLFKNTNLNNFFVYESDNFWTILVIGILAIAAIGTLLIFTPTLVQSWLRK